MPLTREKKQELIGRFGREDGDTGSAEVQVALLLGLIPTPGPSELVRSAKAATDAILRLYGSD